MLGMTGTKFGCATRCAACKIIRDHIASAAPAWGLVQLPSRRVEVIIDSGKLLSTNSFET